MVESGRGYNEWDPDPMTLYLATAIDIEYGQCYSGLNAFLRVKWSMFLLWMADDSALKILNETGQHWMRLENQNIEKKFN